ncbi:MAG: c-type cytochrome biogenesis protein CcmI, partial [Kiloniellales bacterium]
MMFWLVIGAMTAAAALAVLLPLLRRRPAAPARVAYHLEVYRDQLKELDRDIERGIIDEDEAAAARLEIERRMLAAADAGDAEAAKAPAGPAAPGAAHKAVAAVLAVALPAGAVALYLGVGQPGLPDRPLAERRGAEAPVAAGGAPESGARNLTDMAARLARRLRDQPQDLGGWVLLARTYQELGRPAEAATAYGSAVAIAGDRAELRAAQGEALVYAAQGMVTPAARQAFDKALELDPTDPRARFYLALAAAQAGRFKQAIDGWRALATEASPDTPWLPAVRQRIEETAAAHGVDATRALAGLPEPAAPGPDATDMAAANQISPGDRGAMIRGMVEGLAARLEEDPSDVEGWTRLIRSYTVLNQPDQARAALAQAVAANADAEARLRAAARSFGLDQGSAPRGPDAADIAAAQDMSPDERRRMIANMVQGLASRLEREPDDLEGWLRLARAYGVMGRRQDEAEALGNAARLAPDQIDIKVMRARALSATSSDPPPPEAVHEMRAVLALDPDHLEALWVVGLGAARNNDRAAAAELFRRVLARMPPDAPDRALVQRQLDALGAGD